MQGEDKQQLNRAGVIVSKNGKRLTINSMQQQLYGRFYSDVIAVIGNF